MERIPDVSRAVPRRGQAESRLEGGLVVLVRRRFGPVRRRLLRALGVEPDLTVRLDAVGSAVWELIDGVHTVAQINAALSARFPGESDMPTRLGKFLGVMVSRNLIHLG